MDLKEKINLLELRLKKIEQRENLIYKIALFEIALGILFIFHTINIIR